MVPEPERLASLIFDETGLDFEIACGIEKDRQRWLELRLKETSHDHTFAIRALVDWRRVRIAFEPGKFAGELLSSMGKADSAAQTVFSAILGHCIDRGASVDWRVNGVLHEVQSDQPWKQSWTRLSLSLSKGQLALGEDAGELDANAICTWIRRFVAAIAAILPLEAGDGVVDLELKSYPEGALKKIVVNRFERDRRNRAAAIAIHGTSCMACGLDMGRRYGSLADGHIEIHHVTPVSEMGDDYMVDPVKDLVPLCPNCHAVIHRRNPPLSVEELRVLLVNE